MTLKRVIPLSASLYMLTLESGSLGFFKVFWNSLIELVVVHIAERGVLVHNCVDVKVR